MGHSFLYTRQNTGLLWHTAVRPSIHASYVTSQHSLVIYVIDNNLITHVDELDTTSEVRPEVSPDLPHIYREKSKHEINTQNLPMIFYQR
jgi:hypothetical protein